MPEFISYSPPRFTTEEQRTRSRQYYDYSNLRRSIRTFSGAPVPRDILETIILTAGTAPSGANKQPWRFVVVTKTDLKRKIREAAEKEERENYEHRMSGEWLRDLEPFGTDWHKEFLEIAPALIVVFSVSYDRMDDRIKKNYYVKESVGIACGFLLAAIHHAGLVALTHTPSPMDFLATILQRPENEKPFLLIPVGYPADMAMVPDIQRKSLDDICVWR